MAAAVDFEEQGGGGSELVRLSVGGTPFTSTRSTLARCGFLDALLGWPKLPRDEAGRIFVDRDPATFAHLLTFMRTGCVELPEESESLARRIMSWAAGQR